MRQPYFTPDGKVVIDNEFYDLTPRKIRESFLSDPDKKEIYNETTKEFFNELHSQSAKSDSGKAKLSLVPRRIIWNIAAIREYGNNKYPNGGPDNWRTVEVDRYRDAAYRHFLAYLDDPLSIDEESGYPHLWHLACNIAFLCEMENLNPSDYPGPTAIRLKG